MTNKINLREADHNDELSCVNAFISMIEETENSPNQDLTLTETNVSLFRVMLRESIRVFNVCPIIAEIDQKRVGWC